MIKTKHFKSIVWQARQGWECYTGLASLTEELWKQKRRNDNSEVRERTRPGPLQYVVLFLCVCVAVVHEGLLPLIYNIISKVCERSTFSASSFPQQLTLLHFNYNISRSFFPKSKYNIVYQFAITSHSFYLLKVAELYLKTTARENRVIKGTQLDIKCCKLDRFFQIWQSLQRRCMRI